MSQDLDLSFVIVTNGNRDGLLHTIIEGIRYQKIPQYEIIIIGYSRIDRRLYPEVNYIEAKDLAEAGLLGAMRTLACSQAKFNNIVISDDDMILSSNWYEELKKSEDFQILTTQVRNPDGTRFWDHVCFRSPKYGHIVLESNEQDDDYMYMSGGQSWIMKKEVAEKCIWNEDFSTGDRANMKSLKDYHEGKGNEDTDFSKKCISYGFKIKHNHKIISYHSDATYTCVGRIVRRRLDGRQYSWVKNLDKYFPAEIYAQLGASLFNAGFIAESADVIRYALKFNYQNYVLTESFKALLNQSGETLSDDDWSELGYEPYQKDITLYRMNSQQFVRDH